MACRTTLYRLRLVTPTHQIDHFLRINKNLPDLYRRDRTARSDDALLCDLLKAVGVRRPKELIRWTLKPASRVKDLPTLRLP